MAAIERIIMMRGSIAAGTAMQYAVPATARDLLSSLVVANPSNAGAVHFQMNLLNPGGNQAMFTDQVNVAGSTVFRPYLLAYGSDIIEIRNTTAAALLVPLNFWLSGTRFSF